MAKAAAPVAAAAGAAAGTNAASPGAPDQWNYAVDSLFRQSSTTQPATGAPPPVASPALDDTRARTEVGGIFSAAGPAGALSPEDARHVGQMLAQHRGYPQAEAEQRVVDTFNAELSRREKLQQTARQAAEEARRNAARGSLWLFVSSLLGAFFASLMATFGGRQRDLP
jgi:hypothetical protein